MQEYIDDIRYFIEDILFNTKNAIFLFLLIALMTINFILNDIYTIDVM